MGCIAGVASSCKRTTCSLFCRHSSAAPNQLTDATDATLFFLAPVSWSAAGVSFLPYDCGSYKQTPYEKVSKEVLGELLSTWLLSTLDWHLPLIQGKSILA